MDRRSSGQRYRPALIIWLGWLVALVLIVLTATRRLSLPYRVAVFLGVKYSPRRTDLYHLLPGKHCRPGYLLVPRAFSHGREFSDACWDGRVPFTVDFVLDDEDIALGVAVPVHPR